MELHYNLTAKDLKRGLLLHERRPKGGLAMVRKAERLFFFLAALVGGCLMAMSLFLFASGAWREDFSTALAPSGIMLVLGLFFLWLTSPRRRAAFFRLPPSSFCAMSCFINRASCLAA